MRVDYNNKPDHISINVDIDNSADKKTVHIINILDSSGSMGHNKNSKWSSAVRGVNAEIAALKKDNSVNYLYTLVVFGRSHRIIFDKVPIANVEYTDTWRSTRSTSLYDTIGKILSKYFTNDSVLVKIFTDGEENSSRTWNSDSVQSLISEKEAQNFTITFVGTDKDVKYIVRNLKIAEGNTLVHDNTAKGVKAAFEVSNDATVQYSKGISRGDFTKTTSFYVKSISFNS